MKIGQQRCSVAAFVTEDVIEAFSFVQSPQHRYAVGGASNGAIRQLGGLDVALASFLWVRIRSAPT
jgi:hypothetical protein